MLTVSNGLKRLKTSPTSSSQRIYRFLRSKSLRTSITSKAYKLDSQMAKTHPPSSTTPISIIIILLVCGSKPRLGFKWPVLLCQMSSSKKSKWIGSNIKTNTPQTRSRPFVSLESNSKLLLKLPHPLEVVRPSASRWATNLSASTAALAKMDSKILACKVLALSSTMLGEPRRPKNLKPPSTATKSFEFSRWQVILQGKHQNHCLFVHSYLIKTISHA